MSINRGSQYKVICSSLIPILIVLCSAGAQSNNKIRLALITDEAGGLDKSPLVSLLETQLSQTEGIQVLERAQIDKILQEQQLSLAGLLERNSIIEAGRLLRADAFILLSRESSSTDTKLSQPIPVDELDEVLPKTDNVPKGQLIRVRVAETAHGLRLLDRFEELIK